MNDSLNSNFPLEDRGGRNDAHTAVRSWAVEDADRVDTGFLECSGLRYHLVRLPSVTGEDFDTGDEPALR